MLSHPSGGLLFLQVICEKADRTDIPTIDKKKYLVPSVRQLSCLVAPTEI